MLSHGWPILQRCAHNRAETFGVSFLPPSASSQTFTVAERRACRHQYFYKLSKTYQKDGETNQIIDPTFGFGGDVIRTGLKASEAARSSLLSHARWSQTPVRSNTVLPNPQASSEPASRVYQPSPLQGTTYSESPSAMPVPAQLALQELRLKAQDEKLASQHSMIRQQDTQIRLLTSLIDSFRSTMEDMKSSIRVLQSQNKMSRTQELGKSASFGNLESMVRTLRSTQSDSPEAGQMCTENTAVRALN